MLFILVLGSVPALFAVVVPRHRIKMSSATTSPAQKLGNHIFTERRNEPEIVSVETLADSWFGRGQVDLADLQLYEAIAGPFDRERVVHLFKQKPMIVGRRLLNVFLTLQRIRQDWENQSSEERGSMLCSRLSALGPVATKVGQTLSQRPDMVGEEAAEALQSLQSQNTQRFSNADALHLLEKDWGKDRSLWPVRFLSIEPVAVASLGQVYKGELEDGRQVAVKIQRPDALKSCALDFACFALALAALEAYWRWKNGFDNGDLSQVVDMVAQGIFQELDYRLEAQNAIEFESSLNFLGFVSVPKPILEDNTTTRQILITEWCDGKRLDELDSAAEKRAMARRAVTACTASLVLTGFNHCDPHQGNILYIPQNKELVFLDFGLVSRVDPYVMEQFATGIRACVAGDYDTLASVFQSVGFLGTPLQYREHVGAKWQILGRDGVKQFATDLRRAMARADGGTQRFGALANVLGRDLGKQYKMFTPPYCILLTRTFLTLEGICARADPDFNIYQASMPWALQRALTPTTPDGVRALRSILFDNSIGASTGKLRFQELVQQFFLQEEAQEIESPASVQKLNQNIEQDEAEKRQKDVQLLMLLSLHLLARRFEEQLATSTQQI